MKERLFNLYTFHFVLFLASDRLVYFLFIYLFIYFLPSRKIRSTGHLVNSFFRGTNFTYWTKSKI